MRLHPLKLYPKLLLASLLLITASPMLRLPPLQLPSPHQLRCLVLNTYHEARGEPQEGQIAVAQVVLNRVARKNYPKTICGVVYQPKQFSWTAHKQRAKIRWQEWQKSLDASVKAYNLPRTNVTHYHNLTVSPQWNLQWTQTIKNHVFYAAEGQ